MDYLFDLIGILGVVLLVAKFIDARLERWRIYGQ